MKQVPIQQASQQLGKLIDDAIGGEEIVVVRPDRSAVRLVPIPPTGKRPRFGSAKGLISMSDDFDAPLDDFRDYTE